MSAQTIDLTRVYVVGLVEWGQMSVRSLTSLLPHPFEKEEPR